MDLKTWFDKLTAAKVESMKGEAEGQHLDCKHLGDEGSTKRNLSKVISGFANGAGGVCIWGVDARKINGVDCIDSFPGLENPRKTASRLEELSVMATSPGVPGVVHRPLIKRGGGGFVATFVPAMESGPHMARYGEDRYYQRIGQSFLPMEHFQVADMFGRRARPALELTALSDPSAPHKIAIQIRNVGRGAAQAPFIELTANPPFHRNLYGIDGNRTELLTYSPSSRPGWWMHTGGTDFVIHPTMSVLVGGVWLGLNPGAGHQPLPKECVIHYKVGALGVSVSEGEMVVPLPY